MSDAPFVTPERWEQVAGLLSSVTSWTDARTDIRAAALVGSWARAAASMNSDVDLVLLTSDVDAYISSDDWSLFLGAAEPVRTGQWGVLTERRFRLPSGLEIEFGFAPPEWADTNPPDEGTLAVVRNGCHILSDPDGRLARLMRVARLAQGSKAPPPG